MRRQHRQRRLLLFYTYSLSLSTPISGRKLSEETSGNDKASGKTDASVTTETFGLSIEETVNTGFGVRFNGIFYSRGRRKFLSSYLRETEGVIEEDRSIYHPPKKKVILNPNYGKRTFYVQPAVS